MRGYASRIELCGRAIRDSPGLFARAPWFDSNAAMERAPWEGYLDADRVLPGGITERVVFSFEWRRWIAVPLISLGLPRRMWERGKWRQWRRRVSDVFTAFVESVPDKFALMVGPPVPEAYRLVIWRALHEVEVAYVHALAQRLGLIQACTEMGVTANVHADAVLWTTRQLRADYRTAKKAADTFWSDTVRYERRCWSEYGYLVHCHSTEV